MTFYTSYMYFKLTAIKQMKLNVSIIVVSLIYRLSNSPFQPLSSGLHTYLISVSKRVNSPFHNVIVCPKPKVINVSYITNLRHISLLSIFSKIFEKLISFQIKDKISQNINQDLVILIAQKHFSVQAYRSYSKVDREATNLLSLNF